MSKAQRVLCLVDWFMVWWWGWALNLICQVPGCSHPAAADAIQRSSVPGRLDIRYETGLNNLLDLMKVSVSKLTGKQVFLYIANCKKFSVIYCTYLYTTAVRAKGIKVPSSQLLKLWDLILGFVGYNIWLYLWRFGKRWTIYNIIRKVGY